MRLYTRYTILLAVLVMQASELAARTDSLRVQTILPYLNSKKELVQDIFIDTDSAGKQNIDVACYRFKGASDSVLVYSRQGVACRLREGAQVVNAVVRMQQDSGYVNDAYYQMLRRAGSLPAGDYHIRLTLKRGNHTERREFSHSVDSALSAQSSSRSEFQNALGSKRGVRLFGTTISSGSASPGKSSFLQLDRGFKKVSKAFRARGLETQQRPVPEGVCFDVYYHEHFIGYYNVAQSKDPLGAIDKERQQLAVNVRSGVSNELKDIQSIFSQVRELNKKKKADREGTAEVGISTYVSNGQEEHSANENNYYELHGSLEVPIMDIPVSVEGFYTSQDKNRVIKASYIRFHYDAQKAKDGLLKLISGYNEKYERTVGKGKGLGTMYEAYVTKLSGEKGRLVANLSKGTGITDWGEAIDTSGLRKLLMDSLEARSTAGGGADTGAASENLHRAQQLRDSANTLYENAMAKYRKAQELEQNVVKYRRLLDQYQNTTYFDSALAYDQVKELNNADDLSYKELSKKASALLPEGNVKKFFTGLTHVDAGIFNKQESAYTLSGQTIKGLDAGYDFGIFQAAFTVGRVEYAGRDGSLDKYTGYSARVNFKPVQRQKVSVIYYGYTPSKKMLQETSFFKDVDVSMPSFRSPVHIISLNYSGDVAKNISFETEVASSFRKNDRETGSRNFGDQMAYNIKATGDIPNTSVSLTGGYEHVGKQFENNSAPVNLSGIKRITAGAVSGFFRNFLTVGVNFHHLEQQSFSGKGGNNKWGFEIKTNSRRYPSVGLSYKPFATFRSQSDTLDIPQRPMIGAVWTGKASYQIKKKDYSLRFTAIYNNNATTLDTMVSRTSMFQLNAIYQARQLMTMLNVSRIQSDRNDSGAVHQSITAVAVNGGFSFNEQLSLNAGVDGGAARFGLSRLGGSAGCVYRFRQLPVTARIGGRYMSYRLAEGQPWRQIVAGNVELLWRLQFKLQRT